MYPVLFQIGPFSLHSLWLFTALALITGALVFAKTAKRQKLDISIFTHHSISIILVTLLLSRLVFFITHLPFYMPTFSFGRLISFIYIWDKGLSFWGALLGFLLMLVFICIKRGESILKWLDALIVPIGVGIIIGNFGQFMDGQGYGSETILPWGVTYESINVKYTVPIHPTQIYSMVYIGVILYLIKKYRKHPFLAKEGNIALGAITAYTFFRFFAEFLRGDDTIEILGIRLAAVISAIIFFITGNKLFKRYKAFKKEIPPSE